MRLLLSNPLQEAVENHVLGKKLQTSRDVLERFAYSCSHGIRGPLKSMDGLIMLMKKYNRMSSGERDLHLSLLRNSVTRMQSIIDHFYALKVNAEADQQCELINVKLLLTSILKDYRRMLKENNILLKTKVSKKTGLWSHRKRLKTILNELISNAIAFYDKRQENRQISIFVTSSSSGCNILIKDNGIGIDPDGEEKIFSLFYRGAQASSGAGMGLFVARQAIEKMKGTLTYKRDNPGSMFSIWIPNQLNIF